MKRLIVFACLTAPVLAPMIPAQVPNAPGMDTSPAAAPAAPAPAGPSKIAVVAFQVAVSQTNEFQRNFADLQKKWEPKRQQLKTMSDELDNSTKQLQAQADKLSDADRAARAKAIDEKKKVFDRSAEEAQSDFQQEMQEMFNTTASKVFDVLSNYAEQNGYTLVLDFGQQTSPIMYAVDANNITKAVIEAYNVKSGVPAPPPPAPTPQTAPKSPAPPNQ